MTVHAQTVLMLLLFNNHLFMIQCILTLVVMCMLLSATSWACLATVRAVGGGGGNTRHTCLFARSYDALHYQLQIHNQIHAVDDVIIRQHVQIHIFNLSNDN